MSSFLLYAMKRMASSPTGSGKATEPTNLVMGEVSLLVSFSVDFLIYSLISTFPCLALTKNTRDPGKMVAITDLVLACGRMEELIEVRRCVNPFAFPLLMNFSSY